MNEEALKARLKSIAQEKGIPFNQIWKQLLLERFLARLAKSNHNEKLIFKGGLLLSAYLEIGRETIDIDFLLTKTRSEYAIIENTFRDIISITIEDSVFFEFDNIESLDQPHMEYPGFRISLHASFGKMRDKIQIDIGIDDAVIPIEKNFFPFEYKGKPIFEGEITLMVYPVETIFAEKLETIISKGAINSRMKDYHDLLLMIREPNLINADKLSNAIKATFVHRNTSLKIPLMFDESGIQSLQRLWTNHLRGLGNYKDKLNMPKQIPDVIREINQSLSSILNKRT